MKIFCFFVGAMCAGSVTAGVFEVERFGAKGDGRTKDTAAIQRAIDWAWAAGGGTVRLGEGTFVSGSIYLRSNVDFFLDEGAVLKGSPDKEDYNPVGVCPQNSASKAESASGAHLILCIEQTNVTVRGTGRIDGNSMAFIVGPDGKNWPGGQSGVPWRPSQMLYFVESTSVRVEGVTLVDSAYWSCFFHGCSDVVASNLLIRTRRGPVHTHNGDGIDVDCCRNVLIADCDIDTADDSITLRANHARLKRKLPCENVRVERCRLSSACNAIRLGVGDGVVRDAVFRDIAVYDTRTAVNFVGSWRRGGKGVDFENILFEGLEVEARQFCKMYPRYAKSAHIRAVRFSDVSGSVSSPSWVYGRRDRKIDDVTFENVVLPHGVIAFNIELLNIVGGSFSRVALTHAEEEKYNRDIEEKDDFPGWMPNLSFEAGSSGHKADLNVRFTGAKGDGVAKDTRAIQKAIDICAISGGRVTVPPGTYLTGSVWLKDNVELHLEEGAVLLGSPDLADYNEPDAYVQNWGSKNEGWSAKHLILAVEKRNVAITGKGVIDGNARSFFAEKTGGGGKICWRQGYVNVRGKKSDQGRPGPEIVFVECSGVTLRSVTFSDMSCWSCLFHGSENITVGGVTIRNNLCYANTDGFDIDSCRNVTIGDCDITTGDDAVAIRGNPARLKDRTRVCENIRVSNIVCRVSADGIRVGVGNGAIRNVRVSDIRILSAGRGLHVQCCYGNPKRRGKTGVDISDVVFERISIADTCSALCVAAGSISSSSVLENIRFRDIDAEAFSSVVVVAGNGDTRPNGISFENCHFRAAVSADAPLDDCEYGVLEGDPNGAVRIEKADAVAFVNCSLLWSGAEKKEFGRALSVYDSQRPKVDGKSVLKDRVLAGAAHRE